MTGRFKRYLLLQLPGLAVLGGLLLGLHVWLDLAAGWIVAILVAWAIKDLAIYPFVRRAYERREAPDPLIGRTGEARQSLASGGWVRVGGELWRAVLADDAQDDVTPGGRVRVRERRGLELVVEPLDGPPTADARTANIPTAQEPQAAADAPDAER